MKIFWSKEKNEILKETRKISFEEIEKYILEENYIDVIENKNYKNQSVFIIEIANYIYLVPFISLKEGIILKTIFPSRKHTKIYLEEKT